MLLLDPEHGAQVDHLSTHYINGYFIFLKAIEDSNPPIYAGLLLEGVYIFTENNVISNFRFTASRAHATAAVTVTKLSVWKILTQATLKPQRVP